MSGSLCGKVCLVTGGTRGIGRGIAVQLGGAGATVYVTGRTLKPRSSTDPGSLEDTAKEIESRGGKCIPIVCDHSKDDEVEAVFKRIEREQNGQLDLLVNNAYAAVRVIMDCMGTPFWEQDIATWDTVNNVGLRNHYLCTVYAARLMVPRKRGLIVNISSPGGLRYFFNVPYGIGKAAVDRMAADCAVELSKHGVAMVSLWPAAVQTEVIQATVMADGFDKEYYQPMAGKMKPKRIQKVFKDGESTEFAGKAIVELAKDNNIMKKSGRVLLTQELGSEYDFTDIDGRTILSLRSVKMLLASAGWNNTAKYVPGWIKLPYFMLTLSGSKF